MKCTKERQLMRMKQFTENHVFTLQKTFFADSAKINVS